MKKCLALLLLIAAVAPGCGKKKEKKKNTHDNKTSMEIPLANARDGKSSFFDEEVEAFVLADDAKNDQTVVVANADQAVSWVAEADTKAFKAIYFDFDKHDIRADQDLSIDNDAREAKRVIEKGDKVVVEGHACHYAGSKTYNLILSEYRAQEIAHKLEDAGVPQDKLKVVGRGTEMPVVLGGNKEEQGPNRRVEMFSLSA